MDDDRRQRGEGEPQYVGLRMSADEYMALEEDGYRYELIDGVVVMSPSANFPHQDAAGEIEKQIRNYLDDHPVGHVVHEIDVPFDVRLVYNPDLMFVSLAKMPRRTEKVGVLPDLVVEVLSGRTRRRDLTRKLADYEKYQVTEYWIVDPREGTIRFLRLRNGRYTAVRPRAGKFASKAVPGFVLDVERVLRKLAE